MSLVLNPIFSISYNGIEENNKQLSNDNSNTTEEVIKKSADFLIRSNDINSRLDETLKEAANLLYPKGKPKKRRSKLKRIITTTNGRNEYSISNAATISCYPNPAHDLLKIHAEGMPDNSNVIITDLTGRVASMGLIKSPDTTY